MTTTVAKSESEGWLQRLGLGTKELRAWAMYDVANSAFATTIMVAILPIFYADVAASNLPENVRTAYWGYTSGLSLLISALISPVLGTLADVMGAKKRFVLIFTVGGALSCFLLYLVQSGDWLLASILYLIGNIGFVGGNVFYESLLPHIAPAKDLDRVSTAGYALGYFGGGVLLVLNFAAIASPQSFGLADAGVAVRLSFVSVGVWWILFTLPLMKHVREPAKTILQGEEIGAHPLRVSFERLRHTFREVRSQRDILLFLLAFWLYSDGIGTIMKMAAVYGKEVGIPTTDIMSALILVQFIGIPCTFAFAPIASKYGTKGGIVIALIVYTGICVQGYFMDSATEFWVLAAAVGLVQGGSQALSRSLFASMTPRAQSSEYFAFFSISAKFAGIFGPLLFGLVSQLMGGSRLSILFLILFFIAGIGLLMLVDEKRGRAVAAAINGKAEVRV